MSISERIQPTTHTRLRKSTAGALLGVMLFGSAAASGCTTTYNGTPSSVSEREAPPENELADRFNTLLQRATSVGMCLITGDDRLEYSGYRRDALATPPYAGGDEPPGLALLAKRELDIPPPTQLFMRIATEARNDDMSITIATHMLPGSDYAQTKDEIRTDLLEPDQVDLEEAATIGVSAPDGTGMELARDANGKVTYRDPVTDASDVKRPADDHTLDNFTPHFDGVLDGLATVSTVSCQQT